MYKLTEKEIGDMRKKVNEALDKQEPFIYRDKNYDPEKKAATRKEKNSIPEIRERKRACDRDYRRRRNNSEIPQGSPAQKEIKISPVEITAREIVTSLYPKSTILFNHKPAYLRSPFTDGRLEFDIFLVEQNIAFEIQDPYHYYDRKVIERDLIKEEVCRRRGVGLVLVPFYERDLTKFIKDEIQKIYDSRI